jgi:hypothetical protein
MNKQTALNIASNLANAVQSGYITEHEARRRFQKVVTRYKHVEGLKKIQNSDPKLWLRISKLLAMK